MGKSSFLQVFVHKAKYWTDWNFVLTMVRKVSYHQITNYYSSSWGGDKCVYQLSWTSIHPLCTMNMNMCTKCHCNPSDSSWDISIKSTNVNLMLVLQEKSKYHQTRYASSSGEHEYLQQISQQSIQQLKRYFHQEHCYSQTMLLAWLKTIHTVSYSISALFSTVEMNVSSILKSSIKEPSNIPKQLEQHKPSILKKSSASCCRVRPTIIRE